MNLPLLKCPPKLSGGHNCHSLTNLQNITYAYDWIEFTAIASDVDLMSRHTFLYETEKAEHGTPYFRELYKVSTIIHGEVLPFANIETCPRPSFLDTNLVRVKLHNRFCYSPALTASVKQFCREFGLTFKNYTRIDYAVDFQSVSGFADVQGLLHAFASKAFVMKGKGMRVFSGVKLYTGITWGSRASGVAMTLYNKSFEMAKKGEKPWINDLWKCAGFDLNAPVYRLEFSTKKPRVDMVSVDGETYGTYGEIDFLDRFDAHLSYLYDIHFNVAIAEPGKRHSRCVRYSPFDLMMGVNIFRPQTTCIKPQGNNIKKTVIKNLVFEGLLMQHRGQRVEASYCWELAMHYVDRYSLQRWWAKAFDRLQIKSCYMTHWDIINTEATLDSVKKHTLKQAEIWN